MANFVLFKEDIENLQPYIHWETTNKSFIRIALVLKKMGIKNHYFFLSLFNTALIGINPFDKNLDERTKAMISIEAKVNPWYFFRECLRVPVPGGDTIPFQLSRGNLALIWAVYGDNDTGLVQPRQTGKSYATQSIFTHYIYILADNITIGHFDKDQTNCAGIIRTIKDLRDSMPSWMMEKSVADTDRKESISYAKKKNTYLTFPSPIDEKAALKQGRGSTMALIHYDEVAFINYNWVIIPTASNAMLKASEMARKAGLPSPIIYTTTAGNPETRSGAYALKIFEDACPFNETLYDLKNHDELRNIIKRSSKNDVLYMEFSYRQLGKSDEWFQAAAKRSNASEDDIARDLLNKWCYSSEKSVISKDILTKINASARDPAYQDFDLGFMMRWYVDRDVLKTSYFINRPLIMGMDTSENIGRDFTTLTILDPSDMKVLGTCRCNETNTMEVATFVLNLLKHFPRMIWIPERQSTATVIIDFVIENLVNEHISPYLRIYNETIQNYDDPNVRDKANIYDIRQPVGKERAAFGFRTSGGVSSSTSRNVLYKSTMMKTLQMNHSRIYDKILIREFNGLQIRNGRIDHSSDGHDDQVISYLLACYLIYFGKNLHLYGMDESEYLTIIDDNGASISKKEKQEQINLRKRISEIENILASNSSFVLRQSYLRELNMLNAQLNDNIVVSNPVAVTQIRNQQKALKNNSFGALRAFASRFGNALRRF